MSVINLFEKYKRLDGETDDEFIFRVSKDKDKIGTWEDMAELFNAILGYNFGESYYRKRNKKHDRISYVTKYNDQIDQKQFDKIRIEQRNLEKERKKIQTEKLEYNKWLREEARDEMITEKICETISQLQPLKIPEYIAPVHNKKEYLLCLADAHYGICFEIKDLFGNIINEYSPEIFEERMWYLRNRVIELVQKEHIMYIIKRSLKSRHSVVW